MAGDHTWVLQDSKTTYTSPPGDLSTIYSQSLPFLFLHSMPRRPDRVSKQMGLVAQMLSTVLAAHFCAKESEHRRGHCPFASLARTSAPSQTTVALQCASLMARKPGSQSPSLPLRLRFQCLHSATQILDPRCPHSKPNPDPGPASPRLADAHLVWLVGTLLRAPGASGSAAAF